MLKSPISSPCQTSVVAAIMLRKRSRPAVSNKNSIASDTTTTTLPPPNYAPNSMPASPSLFVSPRFFMGFSPKTPPSSHRTPAMSPTSILEPRPFFTTASPFIFPERSPRWSPSSHASKHGLAGVLKDTDADQEGAKPPEISAKVLFGSRLRIQIPTARSSSISPCGSVDSPRHPIEFGVKNKSSQLALYFPLQRSPMGSASMEADTPTYSPREMELSEDYTRVVSRGPNPRTMHIFVDCCIVECCDGGAVPLKEENMIAMDDQSRSNSCGFLGFCHACKKSLGQGKDIFMYRGGEHFAAVSAGTKR